MKIEITEFTLGEWLGITIGGMLLVGVVFVKIAHYDAISANDILGFTSTLGVCFFFAMWILFLKHFLFKKDKEICANNSKLIDDRCSTEWRDIGNGYKERFGWVLIYGGWMVSEEDGEMTSKPERMKVFSDLSSVLVYKDERQGILKDAYPHYATLCFKSLDAI